MEAQSQEVAALLRKIAGLHAAIAKLSSPDVFTDHIDDAAKQRMVREELVRLCSDAEARLEERYSDEVAAADRPLDHLARFPYLERHVAQCDLEHGLLTHHAPGHLAESARVAFVGTGPLPLGPLVLAARHHMPRALLDCYDTRAAATDRARRLARALGVTGARVVSFRTADVVADLDARDLAAYDVVFLAAEAAEVDVVAHLGMHMAAGAALVVRGARCCARRPPVVLESEVEAVARAGFDVLAVCRHRDDTASVIVARKAADGARRNGNSAEWPVARQAPVCGCVKATASERASGGGNGRVRKRAARSCRLDAINETRRHAW